MNTIREIQSLNKREIENGVCVNQSFFLSVQLTNIRARSTEASWHADYRDTAYIYIGGLPFDLTEGDVLTIFSQFGEPVYLNLVRDKESGKSKGFAFLKYEDQRSTDLAVDNLGGATVMGRVLKVDHTRYKRKDDEEELEREKAFINQNNGKIRDEKGSPYDDTESEEKKRPLIKEEKELAALIRDHDEDDPMKDYLIQQKKDEITKALSSLNKKTRKSSHRKKHHHRHHRSRRHSDISDSEEDRRRRDRAQRHHSRSP